ncbi:MAG: hypothetical protein ACFB14_00300 [Leptolyngbyaceae cyanobacterium]
MQLLICPGYHSPALTNAFLQSLLGVLTPEQLWVLPIDAMPRAMFWLLNAEQRPQQECLLQIVAFSAGVVAVYPLVLAWQKMGGTSRLIAVDGWGMPLLCASDIYRVSHDRWTHSTTYFPTPAEGAGYFYAEPAVDHLHLWQSPHLAKGRGSLAASAPRSMMALEFICAVLSQE